VSADNASDALALLIARASTQHSTWDSLDAKTLGVFGLSVAVFSLLIGTMAAVGEAPTAWQWLTLGAAIGLLLATTSLAAAEYLPSQIASYLTPTGVIDTIDEDDASRKWCAWMAQVIESNRARLDRKAELLQLTIWFAAAHIAVCLFTSVSALFTLVE